MTLDSRQRIHVGKLCVNFTNISSHISPRCKCSELTVLANVTSSPSRHAYLKRTKVNTYALVYEWKGAENAKPLLLAAHQDVVPVAPDTYDDWIQPPYSGYYDGEWIWGRGSCDDKAALIGIL